MNANGMSFTIAKPPGRTSALATKGIEHVMEPASCHLGDSSRIVPLGTGRLVAGIAGIVGEKVF